jgi:hypothetical protein
MGRVFKRCFFLTLFAWLVGAALAVGTPSALTSTAKATDFIIGHTRLPAPVPYLNKRANYFVGNGMAAGGGEADGRWDFLAGPDYTCPNYLGNEEIRLVVDGILEPVTMNMYRARNTGIFFGLTTIGDLEVCLLDYARRGDPWAARLIMIRNNSLTAAHQVRVQAWINPLAGAGRTAAIVGGAGSLDSGVSLQLDKSLKCVKNGFCQNWANRHALITFNVPTTTVTNNDGGYLLETDTNKIVAGGESNFGLYHYLHYDDLTEAECINQVRASNPRADAEECLQQWQTWFAEVDPKYSLDRIKDSRARDIVEGGLAFLKMNQARDGGIVANERGWNMSYVRDAYCGLRGLEANGHFAELKSFIQWLDHKYSVHGFIPNACSDGSDTYAHPNGNNGRNCPPANADVEVTALYLLDARDYYQATHDLATLTNTGSSLKYAMDVQLKEAVANGYKLEFSGDETELCGASDVKATGYNRKLSQYWSLTSLALCSASLKFYIHYLQLTGVDPTAYFNSQDNRVLNLPEELARLQDALETDFWRTNLPEFPAGFHDCFRVKADGGWPRARIVNFTLFPIFYGTPLKYPDRARDDVSCIYHYFAATTPLLPITGNAAQKSLGHDLGYLLWGLESVGDSRKAAVYDALVNGPTVGCWGTYNEAYDPQGVPNRNGLRSFETGVNISAIARYGRH